MLRLRALLVSRPWMLVLLLVPLVYAITFYVLPGRIDGVFATQVVVPGLWLLVAAATYCLARWTGTERLTFTGKLLWIGLVIGSFQVAVSIIAGLFLGFGNSPYASNVPGMLTNLAHVAAHLAGMEFSRAYLIRTLGKRNSLLAFGLVALLYGLLPISPARYAALSGPDTVFPFMGYIFLPNISESLLATFLSFVGGPVAALAYRGILMGSEWFSPILPNLSWLAFGFVGTSTPMLGILVVNARYLSGERAPLTLRAAIVKKGVTFRQLLGSALTAMLSLLLMVIILLNVGFLGFNSLVVLTGSMTPIINEGDLVITKAVSLEVLREGDVISYRRNGMNIVHRIVHVERGEEGTLLTTKGDANNTVDTLGPVPRAIQGRVVMRVPGIGWLTIWVRRVAGG